MSFIDEVPSDNLISMHTKSPEELWAETVDRMVTTLTWLRNPFIIHLLR